MLMLIFFSLSCSFFTPLFLAAMALPVESAAPQFQQLTSADFSSTTNHGVWFVEYFSPYCIHCRNFAPTWNRLVEHVQLQDDPGVRLVQVNCATEGDLCNNNDIQGYPALKLYQDGKMVEDISTERDFDLLLKFVEKHARKNGASPTVNPNGVVQPLDKNTFQKTIDEGPVFVKFYAPWCGHCKKLAPTWIQFAGRMKGLVTVAEVNCDDHGSLCSSQGVAGYPTIFFYQHGRKLDYTGRRTLDAMEYFAASALAPPLTHIASSDVASVADQHDVSFLLIHSKLEPAVRDMMEEASQPLHGSPPIFSVDASSDLLASLSLPATQPLPVIISLKEHSLVPYRQLVVSPSSSMEQVSDWLVTYSLPTSTELDAENFSKVMGPSPVRPGSPSRLVVLGAINTKNLAHIDSIKQAATAWHRGKQTVDSAQVVFAWMDKEKWASWLKSVYGVKKGPDPNVVIADHGRLLYYDSFPSGAPVTLEQSSIIAALEGIYSGVMKPKHSENIAERFARWLNSCVSSFQSAIVHHPVRSVLLLVVIIVGVIIGIKRALEEDTRKTSVYNNSKSGARLD
ncbi:thioredoxin-like protein [Gautieria morchelliformis]|nr:thioredoxin-like protein [Gautieria morchelliformis]